MKEGLNFIAFVALSFCFHWVGQLWSKYREKRAKKGPKLEAYHKAAIVTAAASVASQPHFWEGVKEYVVHVVVYSGHVLPPH